MRRHTSRGHVHPVVCSGTMYIRLIILTQQTFSCTHRAQQYVTTAEDRKSELAHVHNALRANGYPEWALTPPPSSAKRPPNTNNNTQRPMLGLPYVAGLSEQLGRIYKSHKIHMYHKSVNTLRSMVVHHKDRTPKEHKCGTIYNINSSMWHRQQPHIHRWNQENTQPEIQRTHKPG